MASYALSTNLFKAFEQVNSYWILALLRSKSNCYLAVWSNCLHGKILLCLPLALQWTLYSIILTKCLPDTSTSPSAPHLVRYLQFRRCEELAVEAVSTNLEESHKSNYRRTYDPSSVSIWQLHQEETDMVQLREQSPVATFLLRQTFLIQWTISLISGFPSIWATYFRVIPRSPAAIGTTCETILSPKSKCFPRLDAVAFSMVGDHLTRKNGRPPLTTLPCWWGRHSSVGAYDARTWHSMIGRC